MDKKAMVEALIAHYTDGNKAQFAKMLGVSPQTISAWIARSTFDSELIYTKCRYVSPAWLLTGEGSMLKSEQKENKKGGKGWILNNSVASSPHHLHQPSATGSQPSEPAPSVIKQPEGSDNMLALLVEKVSQQGEEIGRLKEQIRQLTAEKESNASNAPSSDIANAG